LDYEFRSKKIKLLKKNKEFDLLTIQNIDYLNDIIFPRLLYFQKLKVFYEKLFKDYNSDQAFFSNLSDGENLLAATCAKKYMVETVAIPHTTYQPRWNEKFKFDSIFVQKKDDISLQIFHGYKRNQIKILYKKIKSELEYKFRNFIDNKKYDYLIFSGLINYYHTEYCFKSNIRALEALDSFFINKKKLKIAVKFHPLIKSEITKVFKKIISLDSSTNPKQIIKSSKFIINLNNSPQINELINKRKIYGLFNDNFGQKDGDKTFFRKVLKKSVSVYASTINVLLKELN
jgi:hypothetical protein